MSQRPGQLWTLLLLGVASIPQYANGYVVATSVHLDSHADCCVFSNQGKRINLDISRTVNLSPFKLDLGIVNDIYVSTIAIAYNDPKTLLKLILIFPESLIVPGMEHYIMCPNQLRDNDIKVFDIPLIFTALEDRNEPMHTIANDLVVPLFMEVFIHVSSVDYLLIMN
jgi:hypothetical protein